MTIYSIIENTLGEIIITRYFNMPKVEVMKIEVKNNLNSWNRFLCLAELPEIENIFMKNIVYYEYNDEKFFETEFNYKKINCVELL